MHHVHLLPPWKRYLFLIVAILVISGGTATAVGMRQSFLGAAPGAQSNQQAGACQQPTFTASPVMSSTATTPGTLTAVPSPASSPAVGVTATDTATATPTVPGSPTSTATATASPDPTSISTPCTSPTTTPTGMLHVKGTQIVDSSGRPVILRGAQIESGFNYIKTWQRGDKPTATLTSSVFQAMSGQWKMNALRLPISNWIYDLDPTGYTAQLEQVIGQANAAGLYVILDLHDDAQSGSPYGKGADVPKTESVAFWKVIASHFKANPMVLFDVYNEPHEPDWNTWLHGGVTIGGATAVGFPSLVSAIRSVGAEQIIVVEPGSAAKGNVTGNAGAEGGGWASFPPGDALTDPNIAYSLHVYHGIADSAQQQDARWGPILNHFPLLYGEWSFEPNALHAYQCRGVPHDQADQVVNSFLSYMDSRQSSWIAWDFHPFHLIQDTMTFTPTTLDIPWTCGDTTSHAGMGTLVKQHLIALASGTTTSMTTTPTP